MIINRNKTALTYKDEEYSYTDVLRYSSVYQQKILSSSETPPKKVVIYSENCPEYFFAAYGAFRAKTIVVTVDANSTEKELAYILNDCKPEIIFTSESKYELTASTLASLPDLPCKILTKKEIDISTVNTVEVSNITIENPDETLLIIYTSGTTGTPKGVMLSYTNIMHNIRAVCVDIPIYNEQSNVLVLLPLHHSFPFIGTILAPMFAGATAHLVDQPNAESILGVLQSKKITLIIGVPRLYDMLARGIMAKINASIIAKILFRLAAIIGSNGLSKFLFKAVHDKFGGHIKYLVSGGAALSKTTGETYKTLGFYVLEGYGMTECAPMISFTRPGKRKVGYCGNLLPNMELKISENGEICVRGANVMQGYYNRPEETSDIIRDGWLHTGDVGEYSNRYGIRITGRIKEIIVTSNGKNINPLEIENEIMRKTAFMKEAAVFMYEDVLRIAVYPDMNAVRNSPSGDVKELLRQEILQYNKESIDYKKIRDIHITSEELPKTRLGKIQRFKLEDFVTQKVVKEEDLQNKSQTYMLLKKMIENEISGTAHGEDHFEIDLALDSLGRVSLLAYIENVFGVQIPVNGLDEFHNLNKLSAYVEQHTTEINESKISWSEIFSTKASNIKLPRSGTIHWIMFHFIKIGFRLFYRFKGREVTNVPDSPCIFVGNHRSGFDAVFITSLLKWQTVKNTFFFAKDKHFKSSWARFMAARNNIILVNVNKNLRESLRQMFEVLKRGKNIVIFPEGTRSKDSRLKSFKDTFAILSHELNVPIVPVVIRGSESATYRHIRIPRFMSNIEVQFLPSIYPNNLDVKQIIEAVENVFKNTLGK